MKKKLTTVLSLILVFAFMLTGCGKGSDIEEGILYTALSAEPGSLDPGLAQSTPESWVLSHLYTGLLTYDEEGNIAEGMAEMPKVSSDGLTYTFTIRDGMKWSNGDMVTANDFEYEWLRILDPNTAATYAYQLYYIEGAEEYNTVERPGIYYAMDDNGQYTKEVDHEVKYTDADLEGLDTNGKTEEEVSDLVFEKWLAEKKENVGIKSLDEKTLEIKLVNPVPYFAELTAFYTFYPVNEKVAKENPDWSKEGGEKYVSNGAFTLKNWSHNDKIELVKNENWYDAEKVSLKGLSFDILEDNNTIWQNYEAGKYSVIARAPQEIIAQKYDEKDPELKIGKLIATNYINFNVIPKEEGKNPFTNKNIRQAFSMAIDRKTLVENVTKGGQIAAEGMVPFGIKDENGNDFREANGTLIEYNPEKAKELLTIGLEEEGLTLEDLSGEILLYNTDMGNKKISEAIQQMLVKDLGAEIQLENVDFNVKVSREIAHDFDLTLAGWTGDYQDPMTMLDIFITNGAMNDSGYSNEEYDKLIETAKVSSDQNIRMSSMKEAEKLLMEEMPVMPIFYNTLPYFVQDNVSGVYKPLIEYPIMTYAVIENVEK